MGSVAVLGATGCVGGGAAAAFARAGHRVVAVARGRAPVARADTFVPLDVAAAAPGDLAGLLESEGVDAVVNATGGWLSGDAENEHAHVRLVENLIEGLALLPRPVRLVQLGSIHEYGPVPEGRPIDESVEPRPETAYARTKLAGAEAVLRATRAGRIDGVVLRAVNICGPAVTPASFLGAVVRRLRAAPPGEPVELEVVRARRDFLDVRDLAAAAVKAATLPVTGQVINVGRGEAPTMREIIALLFTAAGFPADGVRERAGRVESRGGDWVLADITLAGKVLGWEPRIGLPDSLKDMWEASADTEEPS
ncbi:NAD(P)-dependent oxidoreductase [Actinomadura craniellae]|uniref:NAD(P)-dependent oxidoreductase n=1 Tax=Actinomadura craniellae TaxID=2231787 RepID=A0A365H0W5_9ACTN|nr:NAD(P)-dependent oxidoreductase [Actinomadura craniellae]RAY12717.1 NAD(P)-dependent oxidoreductase [Actinomadura craniellae]